MYSVEVTGTPEVAGEGKARRSVLSPDKLVSSYPSAKGNHQITTLYENFLEGIQRAGKDGRLTILMTDYFFGRSLNENKKRGSGW